MLMLLLFCVGLFAGTVDAIAGGGGLITLPLLLSTGMPPHIAFGTSKLQAIVGTGAAVRRYHRQGLISFKSLFRGLVFGLFGSVLGSILAQSLSSQILNKIIPILLVAIFVYTLSYPKLGMEDRIPRMKESLFYTVAGFVLAFYDGFFGPGVGAIWIFCLTFFLGYNLIKATAYAKLLNLNSSVIATICFIAGGNVDYRIALFMATGQLIGGRIGASLAINKGARIIRPIFLSITTMTILILLYRSYTNDDLLRIVQQYGIAVPITMGLLIVTSAIFIYRRRRHA